ncbi:ABC transporter ATP-binding protein [Neptunomonas antarctica]|uniref:Amino acid/amide ABC transporter ATP-binding protein 1, HAAT family n=1 Tax=Neptunomonas antarctica TaxID=619304 RepID=A0A1N7L0G4_9GAMM|nr:ABC transporter ATP-binding protein [Neptunomonas antarctica]SIS67333.1 amino acid/amide ABC transporter ATP-binding protein 1, HAAT family [Neptunomonas antarctica]
MTSLIETRALARNFGAVTAAADINVTINAGEIVGVIGSNGAGKTTFINMVTGYLPPSSGEILFKGKSILGKTPRQVMRAGICRSFQVAQLFPDLTVLDNVLIAYGMLKKGSLSLLRPLANARSIQQAETLLEEYGIAEYLPEMVVTLPQGVRKLLDIALAMIGKPEVLLLDEPTSGVAIDDKFELMDTVMRAVRSSGSAVLFVEHDMEVIARYSTRLLAFYDGRVLADGPTAEVMSDEKVKEFVTGHHLEISSPKEPAHA